MSSANSHDSSYTFNSEYTLPAEHSASTADGDDITKPPYDPYTSLHPLIIPQYEIPYGENTEAQDFYGPSIPSQHAINVSTNTMLHIDSGYEFPSGTTPYRSEMVMPYSGQQRCLPATSTALSQQEQRQQQPIRGYQSPHQNTYSPEYPHFPDPYRLLGRNQHNLRHVPI